MLWVAPDMYGFVTGQWHCDRHLRKQQQSHNDHLGFTCQTCPGHRAIWLCTGPTSLPTQSTGCVIYDHVSHIRVAFEIRALHCSLYQVGDTDVLFLWGYPGLGVVPQMYQQQMQFPGMYPGPQHMQQAQQLPMQHYHMQQMHLHQMQMQVRMADTFNLSIQCFRDDHKVSDCVLLISITIVTFLCTANGDGRIWGTCLSDSAAATLQWPQQWCWIGICPFRQQNHCSIQN